MEAPLARTAQISVSPLQALNVQNISAGLAIVLLYAFGPVPFYLATAANAGIPGETALAGFFVCFASAGFLSVGLALVYRQPLGFGWSAPAFVTVAAASAAYSPAEMAGACLIAGILVLAAGAIGLTRRLTTVVPLPIAMAAFAGSSLAYLTNAADAAASAPLVAGAPAVAYFLARFIARPWLPPIGVAILAGLTASACCGELAPVTLSARLPDFPVTVPAFSAGAGLALGLPLAVLVVGAGNVQATGVLEMNGYAPPYRAITLISGATSLLHALFLAPPAAMQRVALATMAGDEAGPKEDRWVATAIAGAGGLVLALFATSLATFVTSFPPEFLAVLMGLVLLTTVTDAMRSALSPAVGLSGAVALVIAASGFEAAGIGATFWAMVVAAALLHADGLCEWLRQPRA